MTAVAEAPVKGTPADAFRPRSLDEVIGQDEVKDELRVALAASQARGDMPGHTLFIGPAGTGKTTLSLIVASALGGRLISLIGPQVRTPAHVIRAVLGAQGRDVIFIDEIHRVYRPALEFLYPIMEDGILQDGTLRTVLPPISFIGATTDPERLTTPMLDRFTRILKLILYTPDELAQIVTRAAGKLGCSMTDEAAMAIGQNAQGVPRVALRMMLAARDYAYAETIDSIGTGNRVEEALPGPCPTCGRNPALEGPPIGQACHSLRVTIEQGHVQSVLTSDAYEWRMEGRDAG